MKEIGKGVHRAVKPREYSSDVHPDNTLNELSGKEWLCFTKSVLRTSYSSELGHELRKSHGANKPPQLMKFLIEFFTKGGQRVLDPFAGVGGTLIGAAICDPPREAVGIEINQKWIDIYHKVTSSDMFLKTMAVTCSDCREIMQQYPSESFDFIATDPPYNIHLERTMSNGSYPQFRNRHTDYDMYSDEAGDLANLGTYDQYLDAMGEVFRECYRVLRAKKYMAFIVRNAYQNSEYVFTHVDLARKAKVAGFTPKGEIVWYQTGSRLRPYGYPYSYVPNICHQFIIILKKEEKKCQECLS